LVSLEKELRRVQEHDAKMITILQEKNAAMEITLA